MIQLFFVLPNDLQLAKKEIIGKRKLKTKNKKRLLKKPHFF